jgi:TatD DNase family protein
MPPKFFDIHAHVNDVQFDADRGDTLFRMHEQGVFAIMVGTDKKSSLDVVEMAEKASGGVYASIGIHPIDDRNEQFDKVYFTKIADSKSVVAVGECGIDYSRLTDTPDVAAEKARQMKLFETQVDFAIERDLPLIIHCRDSEKVLADAHREVIDLLASKKKNAGNRLRGDVHFFSQTIDVAREYFALGFTISFTGVITFTHEYDEVVRLAPLDKIMAETDCPYVAPKPYRGKRNEPVYVAEVVKKIVELRGEDFETVRSALVENAFRTFALNK